MSGKLRAKVQDLEPLARKVLDRLEPDPEKQEDWLRELDLAQPSQALSGAADRLQQAKDRKEKVLVAGDYDADGILGTTILTGALRRQGIDTGFYIPDRIREGYGLKPKTVQMAHDKGYTLLVTVDNGVHATEALDLAKKLGMDVIVTDHHSYETEPEAGWFTHPKVMEPVFSSLCGAAVAYELIRVLGWESPKELVLAGVASVGDQMAVAGETRALIQQAVKRMNTQMDPHLRYLVPEGPVDETVIAFQLVPRLNAVGRLSDMANVNNVVRYFLCDDPAQTAQLADQICRINERRKDMSRRMIQQIEQQADLSQPVVFLSDKGFHEGIVGLAAGHLCQSTGKPVIVAAQNPDGFKASMRSPEGIDCLKLLEGFDGFTALGGHERAAGFSWDLADQPAFLQYLQDLQVPEAARRAEPLAVDPDDITVSGIRELDLLRPFGTGFELPAFEIDHPDIIRTADLTGGRHRRYTLSDGLEAIRFNQSEIELRTPASAIESLEGTPSINVWNGISRPQFLIDRIRYRQN